MKVCFITTSFPAYQGDIQSPFIFQLAKHLVKKGVHLTVVCPFYKKSRASDELIDGISIRRFSYFPRFLQTLTEKGGVGDFRKNIWSFVQLPFFLMGMFFKSFREAKHADILHCQWALSGLVGVFVNFFLKKPLVVSLRGEDLKAIHHTFMQPFFTFVLRHADYITSNNQHHINNVLPFTTHARVIKNGVDTALFKPRNKRQIRTQLHLPNKKIVLFVGWLVPRKGVTYLLEAIALVVHSYKNVLFLFIGDGPLKKSLVEKANSLGIQEHVLFLGSQNQDTVALYHSAVDLFVLPSLYEGMPNVVMEAFASGVPAVATDVSGTSELVQNNINGLLVRSEHVDQLATALLTLLENDRLLVAYGKAARRTIDTMKLTWDHSAENHIKLYKELLQ